MEGFPSSIETDKNTISTLKFCFLKIPNRTFGWTGGYPLLFEYTTIQERNIRKLLVIFGGIVARIKSGLYKTNLIFRNCGKSNMYYLRREGLWNMSLSRWVTSLVALHQLKLITLMGYIELRLFPPINHTKHVEHRT
jgi:hypothetical protein